MLDDKGNKWKEDNYDGYGVFGGKDYYELLAEMNGKSGRTEGIEIEFGPKSKDIKYPNFYEDPKWTWVNEQPRNCPDQGYFYDDGKSDPDEYETIK
jgi:hypothetical protein